MGFTGVYTTTQLIYLNGENGVRTVNGSIVDMTGSEAITQLSALNNGAGVQTVAGGDLKITLTDGKVVNVSLVGATTLQNVMDDIILAALGVAPNRLSVGLNSAGTALVLTDSKSAGGNLTVAALNGSPAAAGLGILGTGTGATLVGQPISDNSADIRITLTDGTKVYVSLSNLLTIQDVLSAIHQADPRLSANLIAGTGQIQITDSAGGSGALSVSQWNDSFAGADLGILGTAGVPRNVLTGASLAISSVILDGEGGHDTITGSPGNDTITANGGNNVISGGGGIDTIIATRDANITLTNTSLTIGSDGPNTLSGIEQAILSGGPSANRIDTSGFNLGPVTLMSGGGLDTLLGGGGNDTFDIDVTGLTVPSGPNDTAHQVTVGTGVGTSNNVVITGMGGMVGQSDLNWVHYLTPPANTSLTLGANSANSTLNLTTNLVTGGQSIALMANTINTNGFSINTGAATSAGNITMMANTITIDGGSVLSALPTVTGGTKGTILIDGVNNSAKFTGLPILGNVNVNISKETVTIGNATIKGGDVEVLTDATSTQLLHASDFGNVPGLSSFLGSSFNTILSALNKISFFVAAVYAESDAIITIGSTGSASPTTINADTFTAFSSATANASAAPISFAVIGAAAGVAKTESNVTIGRANITTTGDMTIRTSVDHTVSVTGKGSTTAGVNIGIAVSVILSDSTANVTKDAVLNAGHDLFVQADTVDRNSTIATADTDPSGMIGVAIAVSVELGHTNAYLDGQATVANNVFVTATQQKEPVSKTIPPGFYTGVSADAGLGTLSSGDLLKDLKSSATGVVKNKAFEKLPFIPKAIDWVKGKLPGGGKPASATGTRPDFQAAAAIAVVEDTNDALAQIGDGVTTDPTDIAKVAAGGMITVNGNVSDNPLIYATASASTTKEEGSNADKTKTYTGTSSVGVSLAVTVGDYHNNADAYISGNAIVNAKGALTVTASPLNAFDPSNAFGTNLKSFADPATYTAKYDTTMGVQVLHAKDTVRVPTSYPADLGGGGKLDTIYTYIAPEGATIDLGTENYKNTLLWSSSNIASAASSGVLNDIRYVASYLNSNLGICNNLI